MRRPDASFPTSRLEHGGDVRLGMRKLARPLPPARPVHLVLRSDRARGPWSLHSSKHQRRVAHESRRAAKRFGIRVQRYSNFGSSLHLVVSARRRGDFQAFLKTLAGLVARTVTGARKGRPVGRFWTGLAYSQVIDPDSRPTSPPSGPRQTPRPNRPAARAMKKRDRASRGPPRQPL